MIKWFVQSHLQSSEERSSNLVTGRDPFFSKRGSGPSCHYRSHENNHVFLLEKVLMSSLYCCRNGRNNQSPKKQKYSIIARLLQKFKKWYIGMFTEILSCKIVFSLITYELLMHSFQHIPLRFSFILDSKLKASFFQNGIEQMQFRMINRGEQVVQSMVTK